MPVSLKKEPVDDTIAVYEMRDGQIGIITKWRLHDLYIGKIVQRFEDSIIVIGEESDNSWPNFCHNKFDDCRVRILPNGTQLTIQNNQ